VDIHIEHINIVHGPKWGVFEVDMVDFDIFAMFHAVEKGAMVDFGGVNAGPPVMALSIEYAIAG
jgi:hypothetical protein